MFFSHLRSILFRLYWIKGNFGCFGFWNKKSVILRQIFIFVQLITKVNSPESTIGMNGYSQSFNIIGTVGSPGKIFQIKLYLIPSMIQFHGHSANKRFHFCTRLIIRSSKPPPHPRIIHYLHLKRKLLPHILNNHHQNGQFNSQSIFGSIG